MVFYRSLWEDFTAQARQLTMQRTVHVRAFTGSNIVLPSGSEPDRLVEGLVEMIEAQGKIIAEYDEPLDARRASGQYGCLVQHFLDCYRKHLSFIKKLVG